MRAAILTTLAALTLTACGERFEKPTQVHVSRVITRAGDRVVTYTAMYDDGIETYIDYAPQGDADMITVERDAEGEVLQMVREGFTTRAIEADARQHPPITPEWQRRFAYIDSLGDVNRAPWSDAHGLMTPDEFQQLETPGGQ